MRHLAMARWHTHTHSCNNGEKTVLNGMCKFPFWQGLLSFLICCCSFRSENRLYKTRKQYCLTWLELCLPIIVCKWAESRKLQNTTEEEVWNVLTSMQVRDVSGRSVGTCFPQFFPCFCGVKVNLKELVNWPDVRRAMDRLFPCCPPLQVTVIHSMIGTTLHPRGIT